MKVYSETGGSGEPLLMIHGIISDHIFFSETAQYLSQFYQVILYDRRGYGSYRDKNITDYSIKEQVKDACFVLKSYTKVPAYIVAHSAGCVIALELAVLYPELVKGLILIEPSFGYDVENARILREWNEKLNAYVKERKITKAFAEFFRIAGIGKKQRGALNNSSDMEEIKNSIKNLENFMYGELNEIQLYLPEKDKVQNIKIPIAVGVTEEGKNNMFAQISMKEARLFGWSIESFPGNHNSIKTEPEGSARRIREVLENLKIQ